MTSDRDEIARLLRRLADLEDQVDRLRRDEPGGGGGDAIEEEVAQVTNAIDPGHFGSTATDELYPGIGTVQLARWDDAAKKWVADTGNYVLAQNFDTANGIAANKFVLMNRIAGQRIIFFELCQ